MRGSRVAQETAVLNGLHPLAAPISEALKLSVKGTRTSIFNSKYTLCCFSPSCFLPSFCLSLVCSLLSLPLSLDNLFLMRDIIDVSAGHDINLSFLSIDQEKSF